MIVISPGELVDRFTIVRLKVIHISDPAKNFKALCAYKMLEGLINDIPALHQQPAKAYWWDLEKVNEKLWHAEDRARVLMKENPCEEPRVRLEFVQVASWIYMFNDKRAALKRTIDELLGSQLGEVKSRVLPSV